MSYLNALRLHFAGRFQANVSTVNNDPGHFDNAAFQPAYQQMEGPRMNPANGWFNPQGDAAWRILGCAVTSAFTPAGPAPTTDPIHGCRVADSDSQAPAKMVDLDPEQQLVSQIWGLQVRITTPDGTTLLRGDFDPAAFIDIWDRATVSQGGDADASAMYQSVLRGLVWGDVSTSPFLTALQASAATSGLLSIKFNVDAFNLDYTSPEFMTGRIVGTIGPATADEPRHMVLGRQLMASAGPAGNFFLPAGGINFCVARLDDAADVVFLDLGNALFTGQDAEILDIGDLSLGVYDLRTPPASPPPGGVIPLATLPAQGPAGYATAGWYARTAGVVALPVPASLRPLVERSPLVISSSAGGKQFSIAEAPSGLFVRADDFVVRASPGDVVVRRIYATRFGVRAAGLTLACAADDSQLQSQVGSGPPYVMTSPPVGTPTDVLQYPATLTTDAQGVALLAVTIGDPGRARWFNGGADYGIDGQVYGVRASVAEGGDNGPPNPWNFISFLVWSGFSLRVPGAPTWHDDLQPIFQQYANLYPVMLRFLDLADVESVARNQRLLSLAFGLPPEDPNAMPVTRDLSPAKRAAILAWLDGGMPLGTPPAPAAPRTTPAADPAATTPLRGGKALAASRRLALRSPR
ncbi:MAG: hypothetical protein H6706_19405 [Myxococcales bacterium]|nr:hypothetical protein [Myxococcales bacterium]